jgi:hypothetical protein
MPKTPGDQSPYSYAYNLYALPTAADLSVDVGAVASVNPPAATAAEAVNNTVQYVVSVPGLDSTLCTGVNEWSASLPLPDSVSGVTGTHDDKTSACNLTVIASVHDAPGTKRSTLTVTNSGHTVSGQAVTASFPISYRSAAYPTIQVTDAKLDVRAEPDVKLSIDLPLNLLPQPGTTLSQVLLLSADLNCSAGQFHSIAKNFTPGSNPFIHSEFKFPDRASFPTGKCTWSAWVQYEDPPQYQSQRVQLQYELSVTPALLPVAVK